MTHAFKRCHEFGKIIKVKRPLEIIDYIKKEDALIESRILKTEQELVDKYCHGW